MTVKSAFEAYLNKEVLDFHLIFYHDSCNDDGIRKFNSYLYLLLSLVMQD